MTDAPIIRAVTQADRTAWAEFRAAMWLEESAVQHMREIDQALAAGDLWVFLPSDTNTASHAAHRAWGFAETERVVYVRTPL